MGLCVINVYATFNVNYLVVPNNLLTHTHTHTHNHSVNICNRAHSAADAWLASAALYLYAYAPSGIGQHLLIHSDNIIN